MKQRWLLNFESINRLIPAILSIRLTLLLSCLTVAAGCTQKVATPPKQQRVFDIEPIFGGMGGFLVKISDDNAKNFAVYHLKLGMEPGSNSDIELPLIARFSIPDELPDQLPATLGSAMFLEVQSSNALLSSSTVSEREDLDEKEAIVERIVEVEKLVPREVDVLRKINHADIANAYDIGNGDIEIQDQYIEDMRIEGNLNDISTFGRATIMLKNTTSSDWNPNFELLVLNEYGVALGRAGIKWINDLSPEERYSESARFIKSADSGLFKYSHLAPSDDFNRPYAIVVNYRE